MSASKVTNKTDQLENPGCAPAIWRKYSEDQRDLWVRSYVTFLEGCIELERYNNLSKEQQHVMAHNMSCLNVWMLYGDGVID